MNQTILVALIGAAGFVIGAILSFVASVYLAQHKIKELELAYRQRLDETYNTNARLHLDSLYVPLNISLTNLDNKYEEIMGDFWWGGGNLAEQIGKVEEFKLACDEFIKQISELIRQGEDSYLTSNLDRHLHMFIYFLVHSAKLDERAEKNLESADSVFRYQGKKAGDALRIKQKKEWQELELLQKRSLAIMGKEQQEIDKKGISKKSVEDKIKYIPAFISKDEFKRQFKYGIYKLKFQIKQVTLGTTTVQKK